MSQTGLNLYPVTSTNNAKENHSKGRDFQCQGTHRCLVSDMIKYKIDVCCLQETKIIENKDVNIKSQSFNKSTIKLSSLWKKLYYIPKVEG